ncbi:MFS general substrate transporter [Polyplosphaeria fusca]|uniref:MFS general substrate transporter n=1 Tax=Polyplosphaeria fusca TaxID=682080 RepID=A0A9P4QKA8_9PLEO|nr:MFS general substrate transporter [Polyplosphaeria fusca]
MSFFGRLQQLWSGVDVRDTYPHLVRRRNFEAVRESILDHVERYHFSKRILFVAASGFFGGSYAIFSTNVTIPAFAYIYWPEETKGLGGLGINLATLCGTCVGMIVFGYLADRFGRKRLYGLELIIVIAGTLGLAQASAGYDQKSMDIYPWIIFWRVLQGIGVGAEYPLSALIASEWTRTESRGRMLAAVFLTQPLAQLLVQGVGLWSLRGIWRIHPELNPGSTRREDTAHVVDLIWRVVILIGVLPALLAIIGRLTIPETPRYLLEIERDLAAGVQAIGEVVGLNEDEIRRLREADTAEEGEELAPASDRVDAHDRESNDQSDEPHSPQRVSTTEIIAQDQRANTTGQQSGNSGEPIVPNKRETLGQRLKRAQKATWDFMRSANGSILLAISFCWFLLDVCFYGLGLDNPRLLGELWLDGDKGGNTTDFKDWNSPAFNTTGLDQPIYQVLERNFTNALYTTTPASIVGCSLFLLLVNRLPRVRFMACIFVALAVIFAITGGSLFNVYETSKHNVTVVFYAISLFLLDLGPNIIIFVLPAELFETRNRGKCYGIAAASGKLGAIVVQTVIWRIKAGGQDRDRLAGLLLTFVPLMLLGALVAWVWIPEVQDPVVHVSGSLKTYSKFRNRSLEEIAEDPTQGQLMGLISKMRELLHLQE